MLHSLVTVVRFGNIIPRFLYQISDRPASPANSVCLQHPKRIVSHYKLSTSHNHSRSETHVKLNGSFNPPSITTNSRESGLQLIPTLQMHIFLCACGKSRRNLHNFWSLGNDSGSALDLAPNRFSLIMIDKTNAGKKKTLTVV